jgi:alkylhydroperoxidase/carboxymuconolactone decarboxylase family protein YurZ
VSDQDDLVEVGREMRRTLFGPEAVDRFYAESPTAIVAPDFARLTDAVLMGQVWTRPGLELKLRSLVTISALVVLGREQELRSHIAAGLRLGLTREQIVEAIMQLAFYAGQTVAHPAFRAAKEVFDQWEQADRHV